MNDSGPSMNELIALSILIAVCFAAMAIGAHLTDADSDPAHATNWSESE